MKVLKNMCGIAGIYYSGRQSAPNNLDTIINAMTDVLIHRGPDSRGIWVDPKNGVALGHRRLAIRELSPLGHQPMVSSCGRFVIVYNGEIYSHQEMRQQLEKAGRFTKGNSDTEVILEACAEWGIERTVEQLIGMFAFAVYDQKNHSLTLVRDRLGIKPLYWGFINGVLCFSSELKSLRATPHWTPRLNRHAMAAFMRHNYIPAPHTIYEGINKLEPGCLLRIDERNPPKITRYWDLYQLAQNGSKQPLCGSDEALVNDLDLLLQDAVKRRMVADVPLGTMLSGGIDSSLVTALMAEQSSQAINTFSIGFEDQAFNEAPYARKIAQHLGTHHTELYVDNSHALQLVDTISHWYDEPFADSSQLPTMLVYELAKKHVTVALSGDGGDELFAGYNRYTLGLEMWQKANIAPYPIRKMLSSGIRAIPSAKLNAWAQWLPNKFRIPQLGDKLHKFANAILLNNPDAMYRQMISHWHEPEKMVYQSQEPKGIIHDDSVVNDLPNFLDRMQFLDTVTYLPDDILTKVDRASMRVALEARVPLLDHRVVEMAWKMPRHMKLRKGQSKWALRQVLYRRVPRQLIERPKMGFGVPLEQWLRGPLREWASELLNETRLKNQGIFNVEPIQEKWQALLQGTNWSYPLWNVLVAQAWLEANPGVV